MLTRLLSQIRQVGLTSLEGLKAVSDAIAAAGLDPANDSFTLDIHPGPVVKVYREEPPAVTETPVIRVESDPLQSYVQLVERLTP